MAIRRSRDREGESSAAHLGLGVDAPHGRWRSVCQHVPLSGCGARRGDGQGQVGLRPETWKNGTPSNNGFVHRGVAYWADGKEQRILFGTGDGYLICLNAQTGTPISSFGQNGRIDLTQGLGRSVNRRHYGVSSPPIICRDVVVMGSKVHDIPLVKAMPPGDVRGFDVRTGRQLWQFNAVPGEGEFGNETWEQGSWKTTGGANVWTLMSADDELGYVYLPFSTPSNDWYGGQRPGAGLFGESLVCLEARTGERVWHFQMVHHGLWDYDPPAAPNLIDVRVNGSPVKAVAQVSKQGFVYVFDRVTGRPIWPIEERPGSAIDGTRREDFKDAARPDEAGAVRPAGRHGGRCRRLHSGAAQGCDGGVEQVQLRPAVHAAIAREADDPDAGLGWRRELGGCGVRSRNRVDVHPIDHEPIGGHDRESGAAVASAVCRNRCADGNPAGGAPVETTLRTRDGHRSQHGQSPVDGAARRPRPSAVAAARPLSAWGGPCAGTRC